MSGVDPLNVLLPTLGSMGDVHPFIALGQALQARGHRATVLTNPIFQSVVESQGLAFLPIGDVESALAAISHPDIWHVRKGIPVLARVMAPAIAQIFRLIDRHADERTVVAFSTLCFGARLAQEKLGIPCASVHLQPSVMRSLGDPGMLGHVRLSASHPAWINKSLFRLADFWLDRHLQPPLNECRASLGLAPVRRVMDRWLHSPELVLGLFPAWFAAPQPDWPPHAHAVGFVLWDSHRNSRRDSPADQDAASEARQFLAAGAPPLIFTAGSAASTMQTFFRESVQLAQQLDMRAMLITNFAEQLPERLPQGIRPFGYVPFSAVLALSALLVHHGGIGTVAQAINAAIPQLIVPNGYDQFDNARRLKRLGLAESVAKARYRSARTAAKVAAMLADGKAAKVRGDYAARIDTAETLLRACKLLEGLRHRE